MLTVYNNRTTLMKAILELDLNIYAVQQPPVSLTKLEDAIDPKLNAVNFSGFC